MDLPVTTFRAIGWHMSMKSQFGCTYRGHPAGTTVARRIHSFPPRRTYNRSFMIKATEGCHSEEGVLACPPAILRTVLSKQFFRWTRKCSRTVQVTQSSCRKEERTTQKATRGGSSVAHRERSGPESTNERRPRENEILHLMGRLAISFDDYPHPKGRDQSVKYPSVFHLVLRRLQKIVGRWAHVLLLRHDSPVRAGPSQEPLVSVRGVSEGVPDKFGPCEPRETTQGFSRSGDTRGGSSALPSVFPPVAGCRSVDPSSLSLDALRDDTPSLYFTPPQSWCQQHAGEEGEHVEDRERMCAVKPPVFWGRFYFVRGFSPNHTTP